MKILLVHQYFLAKDASGGARWNQMAHYWAEQGHEVCVLAGMVDYNTGKKPAAYRWRMFKREDPEPRIRVYRCHVSEAYNSSFLGRAWAYFSFAVSSSIAGFCFASRPDVVVATSPPLTVAVTMTWLKWLLRCPAIFEVRDLWPESALDTGVLKPGKLANMLFRMEADAYRKADWINVLTPAFRETLIEKKGVPPEKISMITNGADPDLFQPGERDNAIRRELKLDGKFAVGYFGAHGKANRLGQLLDAAEVLKTEIPDVQIVLVGDGMEKSNLQSEASRRELSNVTFVGSVAKEVVVDYINAMDVCTAVLMKNDTFKTVYPNKVFDYMCCQRPILIGIDGVARKLVEDAGAGLFMEPENTASIVASIKQLRESPAQCDSMGMSGREFVLKNYCRDSLAAKYLEIVQQVATR
jgi:glycosyltransferase involved in cell wall biosynthesis